MANLVKQHILDPFLKRYRKEIRGNESTLLPRRIVLAPAAGDAPADRLEVSFGLPGWELLQVASGTRARRHLVLIEWPLDVGGRTGLGYQEFLTDRVEALVAWLEAHRDADPGEDGWVDGQVERVELAAALEGDTPTLVRLLVRYGVTIHGDH